jgi:uridine kinase
VNSVRLINISGSSGVGKTTIATILTLVLSNIGKKVLHLCGDDLHKWDRNNSNWKKFTHFNPEANNLDIGKKQLLDLISGNSIMRNIYSHDSGKFIKNVQVDSADIVINEGLHGLYDSDICEMADLNVFINTDEELTKAWKLSRDIESRGYTVEQVLLAIKMRESDEKKYIQPQIKNADIIVNFSRKWRSKIVDLNYKIINNKKEDIFKKVKKFYELHKHFLMTCRSLSFEYELVQGAGGNLSYKFDDKIVVTSSGYSMSNVSMLNGYSVCTLDGIPINEYQKKPSMEIQLHTKINEIVVLHTHPIYLNTILCSENSEDIVNSILDEFDYIPYVSPGKELASVFGIFSSKVVLLENHGLVCCGNSFKEVLDMSLKINKLCKEWLIQNSKTFTTYSAKFKNLDTEHFLFPDAVALMEENKIINDYILHIQKEVGLEPKYLTFEEVDKIKNMEAEKYRRDLV